MATAQGATLVSWNVNGIRAAQKKGFEAAMQGLNPDWLCLQEIKAESHQVQLDLPELPYRFWHSADKKGYSGTAIFTRHQPIAASLGIGGGLGSHGGKATAVAATALLSAATDDGITTFALPSDRGPLGSDDPLFGEGRVITLEYDGFFIVTVYTPNAKRELSRLEYRTAQWDAEFRRYVSALDAKKPVIMCGDFNVAHKEIDLKNPKTNHKNAGFTPEERESFSALLAAGFTDTFREFEQGPDHYSWWSYRAGARERNVGWRIDYVLTSQRLKAALHQAAIHPKIMGSDHCPVSLTFTPPDFC